MRRLTIVLGALAFLLVPGSGVGAPGEDRFPAAAKAVERHSVVVRLSAAGVYEALADRLPRTPWSAPLATGSEPGRLARRAEAEALLAQEPVIAAVTRLGATVVSRYVASTNGLLVHGTTEELAALHGIPGVRSVEPAPSARPALSRTVPRIGADALAALRGYAGQGTVIAVLDSGIDYTHAALGGPGTQQAYALAADDAQVIGEEYEGRSLFPTAKVVGGWDFVGPNYTSPDLCPPAAEAAGLCTSTPHPDPDPLDEAGHGTFVAGAAAGIDTASLGHGVAPGARLLALKIYGPPSNPLDIDEAADVVIDALDWCVRANLGLEVPGIGPPEGDTVDVVNMSFGETFGQGSRLYDEVIDAAVGTGIVVVAAVGNGQNRPYVATAPGTSPHALAVAGVALGSEPARDEMAGHSGRGPGRFGALKPDLSAPGLVAECALRGTGTGAASASGTSLASPHVAGAAAVLVERSRSESLGLAPLDVAALLVNYAVPLASSGAGVSVARQGGGLLAVDRAGVAPVVVRAGDIASLNLGALSLTEATTLERSLVLRNLSDRELAARLTARMTAGSAAPAGMMVIVPGSPVALPPREEREVAISFSFTPEQLAAWPLQGQTIEAAAMDALEQSGTIDIVFEDGAGQPLPDVPAAGVPFYALARSAAAVAVSGVTRDTVELVNRSTYEGRAELFVLPDGGRREDPDEPNVPGAIDLRQVGVRFEPAAGTEPASIAFGVSLHEADAVPWLSVLELHLDRDRDGRVDFRIRSGPESALLGGAQDRAAVVASPIDPETGQPSQTEVPVGRRSVELHARTYVVRLPLSALGRQEPFDFDFHAVARGLGEDWLGAVRTDSLPDGAPGPCGADVLAVRPSEWTAVPWDWSAVVPGHAPRGFRLVTGDGDRVPALLALLPDNRLEAGNTQAQAITAGADPEPRRRGGCLAFLPAVTRHHVFKQTEGDLLYAQAMAMLDVQEWAKLEHNRTDPRDPAGDARRSYRFRNVLSMRMTHAPLNTDWYWDYLRIGDQVFVMRHREGVEGEWTCTSRDEWTLLWPEYVALLRQRFPAYGWRVESRGDGADPDTWQLRSTGFDGARFLARIHVPSKAPTVLSRVGPAGEIDVYKPYDFGVPDDGLKRPRPVPCR